MARYPLDVPVKYAPATLGVSPSTETYTTVYLGNYADGDYREGVGSHCGVDVVTAKPAGWVPGQIVGAPVYACLAGKAVAAGDLGFEGNCVVLEHPNVPDPSGAGTCTLYSCYLHLSEVAVSEGDSVAEGEILGKTGNTGTAPTGEHLHFQIDRADAPFHPYWPYTLQEAKEKGFSFMAAVNAGLGIERAKKWTVNPLVYVDSLSGYVAKPSSGLVSAATDIFGGQDAAVPQPAKKPVPADPSPNGGKPVASADSSRLGAASDELFGAAQPASGKTSAAASPVKFKDAGNDAAIAWVASEGIAGGFPDGTFRPDTLLTRAEFLKLSFKFGNIPTDSSANLAFPDVDPSHWSAPYVATAHARGWIRGYADGKFRPNATVTRAEALAMAVNMLVGKENLPAGATSMRDVASSHWAAPYVAFAEKNGLMATFAGPKFLPQNPMLRKRMAELLYKMHTNLGLRAA